FHVTGVQTCALPIFILPERAGTGRTGIRKIAHAAPRSDISSASRSRMALSSSGERLAHCSGGKGLDHSMTSGAVKSGGGLSFLQIGRAACGERVAVW